MKRFAILATFLAAAFVAYGAAGSSAGEIGYVEDFALANDRLIALKQLIPGTEDFYYYHALHYQNTEQYDKAAETIAAWTKRYGRTSGVLVMENRQALLTYEKDPQAALALLRNRLNLQFNHQREILHGKPNLPLVLDQVLIARETLARTSLARWTHTTDNFEDSALDWLSTFQMHPDQRRHLLARLARPDLPNLTKLIADDFAYVNSQGFGGMNIHRQLTLAQLEEMLKLRPELLNQTNFVNAYLAKLRPSADVDWKHDEEAREAYFNRLMEFVDRLSPVYNSLKAHVIYHRLVHDRAKGIHNKELFLKYLQLPRNVGYIARPFAEKEESRRYPADVNANYNEFTLLPPIGNDESVVRAYLAHFFVEAMGYKEFEPYIHDTYLKELFAETKIVNGLGDAEQWYSLLPPEKYQALKERIDLEFDPTMKEGYAIEEGVAIDLWVKNVENLIVKVFEINAANYYRQNERPIDTDINLDGLVANEEKTYAYKEPALRRVKRRFEFPQLNKAGVYVVDFIGNGKSSRALIRKGQLRYLVRSSTAGQVFTILNETNQKLNDASIFLAGHEYKADKEGLITIPYSNQPGTHPIVISHGSLHQLERFQHESESYSLVAGIHVDRESLLARRKAEVVVRPQLYVNGTSVSLSLLEEVRLTITSTDLDNVSSTRDVPGFKLLEDRETTFEIQVPQRLNRLTLTLTAKVQNLSQAKKIDIAAARTVVINEIDKTDKIEDLHLLRVGDSWGVDLLGKTGEPKADRAVHLSFKHRDFKEAVQVTLQTNPFGRIVLGALADIVSVTATGPEGTSHTWTLPRDRHSQYQVVNGRVGDKIEIPYTGTATKIDRSVASLLEKRDNTYSVDRYESLTLEQGMLVIQGLPAGDYELFLKEAGQVIEICVTAGDVREGYVLGKLRQLEQRNSKPLQLAAIDIADDTVKIQLRNATKFARVHVLATRFQPEFPAYEVLAAVADAGPYRRITPKTLSSYIEGRDIGDEYRYLLERKYARKFPGNMLNRPSLLLNPWAIRSTETSEQLAREGGDFSGKGSGAGGSGVRSGGGGNASAESQDFHNLDFLGQGTTLLLNLEADEKGTITIKRSALGMHQHLQIVAVDPLTTAGRHVFLPEPKTSYLDLRLATGLDPKLHFTQQKQITVLGAKQPFVVADVTSGRFELVDSLSRVYLLYTTLSHDPKLAEFNFLPKWHKLKPEEKQALYSKYACHELHFFLFKRDPEFFRAKILPYLANKKDKTFLDRWFLGDSLTDYLSPWKHAQLNTVEKILLAQRMQGEPESTSRFVLEGYQLLPPNVERFNHLFRTALRGSALEAEDRLGLAMALDRVEKLEEKAYDPKVERFNAPAQSPPPPGAAMGGAIPAPQSKPSNQAGQAKQALELSNETVEAGKKMKDMAARNGRFRQQSRDKQSNGDLDSIDDLKSNFFQAETERRSGMRQLYRKLDKTQEWVENNYYHLAIQAQNAELVKVNAFWRDYAAHDPNAPFLSRNLAEASGNFTEMMYALSLLDLPFEAEKHETKSEGVKFTVIPAGPAVAYHEEIRTASNVAESTPILVSQNFYRHGDRHRMVDGEQVDKYVSEEFLIHTVYGCQIVVTNPTSSRQKLEVLLQIPAGAMPVQNGQTTRSVSIQLEPFHTQTVDYLFYFPQAGEYRHYPVHVSKNEQLLAFSKPHVFKVVKEPTQIDRESWEFVSQNGSNEEVVTFLKNHNVQQINLEKIAFRMRDAGFFKTIVDLLTARHVFHPTLWSYGVFHNQPAVIREFLQHREDFVNQVGPALVSTLLVVDPVLRKTYEHMDYAPLVNSRTHQLGRRRQILNDRFFEQYHRLLNVLAHQRDLNDEQRMAVTYYMLLQDRIEEALAHYGKVDAGQLKTKLQYDYFTAYLAFYQEDTKKARAAALPYLTHPVDRWRNAFTAVVKQIDQIEGKGVEIVDKEDRNQAQTNLASTEANFDFKVESRKVVINYQNLETIKVNYYLMDVELLFSRNPFVQQFSGQFSFIKPNGSQTLQLPPMKHSFEFDLPEQLHNSNVLVEIVGGGQTKAQAYYANSLGVQVVENYGEVKITHTGTGKPLAKVYVKVYAQMKNGETKFYKDGYSDLRGRFDYTSLNTNELDFVQKFSVLVMSEDNGAVVKEASPPKR